MTFSSVADWSKALDSGSRFYGGLSSRLTAASRSPLGGNQAQSLSWGLQGFWFESHLWMNSPLSTCGLAAGEASPPVGSNIRQKYLNRQPLRFCFWTGYWPGKWKCCKELWENVSVCKERILWRLVSPQVGRFSEFRLLKMIGGLKLSPINAVIAAFPYIRS